MKLRKLPYDLTVCKVVKLSDFDQTADFFFIGKTDEELSVVCLTKDVPERTVERSDGWRGFRIEGTLDFALVGILSKLSAILAQNKIGIFAVSTFNTDYILVKADRFVQTMNLLTNAGYMVKGMPCPDE